VRVTSDALCFATFELQPVERRLVVGGVTVTVGARAFDVLLALAERAGHLMSKQELLDLAWPGLVVEENNLQVQIATLRKLLGPQAIATVPGRGYRLAMARRDAAAAPPAVVVRALDRPEGAHVTSPAPEIGELFGRQHDIEALGAQVRERGLVTIVGPAGIGKTRLAAAAAREHVGAFADGTRFVELAPLADAALVAPTIARALGVALGDAPSSLEPALQELALQRLLLVLDNCEHVLEAVDAFVTPLRRSAPGIHVLATSQELLRHPEEHVYRLGALSVPERTLTSPLSTRSTRPARCSSSSRARVRSSTVSRLRRRTLPASSRSAAGSTESPSRSNWAPRAYPCSASTACGNGSMSAFGC